MRTTIDKAGRVVIPRALRDEVGLRPGEVELTRDGAGLRIEPVAGEGLAEEQGLLVIAAGGPAMTDREVQALRDAVQR
ncbi:MAG TPA: AbrB/MazE/SpoVT family DNA-binding domain-containing protein [Acidimicrobiales bacterium]|nr:AbrB/MazE/SpoVT family DNA-binding domain-containing protein [Acidimicrobiales bacterium]